MGKETCAENDDVDVLASAVLEGAVLALNLCEERNRFEVLRPVEAHRSSAPRACDRFYTVFVTLRGNVFRRIGGSHDEDIKALHLFGAAEVMRVHDTASGSLQTRESWDIRGREVARGATRGKRVRRSQ